MLISSRWILDVLDCSSSSIERMEAVQEACLKRFSDVLIETLSHVSVTNGAGVEILLGLYRDLDEVWRARLLLSGEFIQAASQVGTASDPGSEESFTTLLDVVRREHAIFSILGDRVVNGPASGEKKFWSPMGDKIAVRREGGWGIEVPLMIGGNICLDFDSPVATRHEIRSGALSQPMLEVSPEERVAIKAKLDIALEQIDKIEPVFGILIRNFTRRIIVRKSVEADGERSPEKRLMSSEHVSRQPGCIRFLNPHIAEKTIAGCMESLLHESIHVFITALENAHGAFNSASRQTRPVSPWSGNLIPNSAFAHAVFIYYACHKLFVAGLASSHVFPAGVRTDMHKKLQHFASGFMIKQRLASQFTETQNLDGGLLDSFDLMQARMQQMYRIGSDRKVQSTRHEMRELA